MMKTAVRLRKAGDAKMLPLGSEQISSMALYPFSDLMV